MKSGINQADAEGMTLFLSTTLSTGSATLLTTIIAGGLALVVLKALANEFEYARKVQSLLDEAARLREQQAQRLRMLRHRSRV